MPMNFEEMINKYSGGQVVQPAVTGYGGNATHTPMGTPIVYGKSYLNQTTADQLASAAAASPLSADALLQMQSPGSSSGAGGAGGIGDSGGFSAPAGFSAPVSAMGTDNGFGMGANGVSGVGIGTGGEATGDSGDGGTGAASSAGGGSAGGK
jgi:hypothetical protein